MGAIYVTIPRATHGIDLRQTLLESLMGTLYVDEFDVNNCKNRYIVCYVESFYVEAELSAHRDIVMCRLQKRWG